MNRANRYWLRSKELEANIQRVRDLHAPKDYVFKLGTIVICSVCRDDRGNVFITYPCPTIKALGGETNEKV